MTLHGRYINPLLIVLYHFDFWKLPVCHLTAFIILKHPFDPSTAALLNNVALGIALEIRLLHLVLLRAAQLLIGLETCSYPDFPHSYHSRPTMNKCININSSFVSSIIQALI